MRHSHNDLILWGPQGEPCTSRASSAPRHNTEGTRRAHGASLGLNFVPGVPGAKHGRVPLLKHQNQTFVPRTRRTNRNSWKRSGRRGTKNRPNYLNSHPKVIFDRTRNEQYEKTAQDYSDSRCIHQSVDNRNGHKKSRIAAKKSEFEIRVPSYRSCFV